MGANLSERKTFSVGDTILQYRVVDAFAVDGGTQGTTANPLGEGKTSVVLKVLQKLGNGMLVARAMKLLMPDEETAQRRKAAGNTEGKSAFQDEIKAIARFSHQNLVKVVDAGEHDGLQFLVMELVDGASLQSILDGKHATSTFWRDSVEKDSHLIVRLARQICWPLIYLHDQKFFHMDVAPKNVFVRRVNDKPHVVLGDIGVGKFVPADEAAIQPGRKMFIAGTRAYTPPVLHPWLNREPIDEEFLAPYAGYWDVYAVVRVLEEMLKAWDRDRRPELEPARLLIERVKNKPSLNESEWLAEELGRLLPVQLLTANVEELSQNAIGTFQHIPIPLGSVPTTKRVRKIIDHPMMERLRLVPQLLLVRSVYPGGVHTRFEHVLGAYSLGVRYLVKLLSQPEFRVQFSKKELEEALLVILLSDLVSFPLDHIYFEMFPDEHGTKGALGRTDLFKRFINFATKEASGVLSDVIHSAFPLANLEFVAGILSREARTEEHSKLVSMLVKSSIDVRVLDYLRRDAHHTGINAGTNIDIDNIIENLCFLRGTKNLGVSRSGVHAVENLLCARYWMYSRVYWAARHRALVAMLRYTLYALLKRGTLSPEALLNGVLFTDEHRVLMLLRDWWTKHAGSEYQGYSLIEYLVHPRPIPFQPVLELSTQGEGVPAAFIGRARQLGVDGLEALRLKMIREIGLNLKTGDVLFDVPLRTTLKLGEDIDVEISRDDIQPLRESSEVVRSLRQAFEISAIKFRVFLRPELFEDMKATNQLDDLRRRVKSFLFAALG
jgi:HD superfamily phosphohydrolase